VPPPSDWLAQALFELKGTLGDHGATLARLDERTLGLARELVQLRSEMRLLVGGVYVVVLVGMTALGWLVSRLPH